MGFQTRDKIEMVVAGVIVISFVGIEAFGLGPEDPSMVFRLLVLAAAFTMFGDNLAKAREFMAGKIEQETAEEIVPVEDE